VVDFLKYKFSFSFILLYLASGCAQVLVAAATTMTKPEEAFLPCLVKHLDYIRLRII
jgi:hypothetical protein